MCLEITKIKYRAWITEGYYSGTAVVKFREKDKKFFPVRKSAKCEFEYNLATGYLLLLGPESETGLDKYSSEIFDKIVLDLNKKFKRG